MSNVKKEEVFINISKNLTEEEIKKILEKQGGQNENKIDK